MEWRTDNLPAIIRRFDAILKHRRSDKLRRAAGAIADPGLWSGVKAGTMQIMHRRTRFLIGLVLLVTMGISLVETVWAAACTPEMGSMAASAMASMDGMDDMPMGHDCMPGHAHENQQSDDEPAPCPFAPAGAAGCAAVASLPGPGPTVGSPAPSEMIAPILVETTRHLLRTASIFHPPKA